MNWEKINVSKSHCFRRQSFVDAISLPPPTSFFLLIHCKIPCFQKDHDHTPPVTTTNRNHLWIKTHHHSSQKRTNSRPTNQISPLKPNKPQSSMCSIYQQAYQLIFIWLCIFFLNLISVVLGFILGFSVAGIESC